MLYAQQVPEQSVLSFACSPHVDMGFLHVLGFLPTPSNKPVGGLPLNVNGHVNVFVRGALW